MNNSQFLRIFADANRQAATINPQYSKLYNKCSDSCENQACVEEATEIKEEDNG